MRKLLLLLILLPGWLAAQDEEPAKPEEAAENPEPAAEAENQGDRSMLGMSILGNEEAPKSLVIVPWKSSRIGDGLGVSDSMNDQPRPVDREVFMREIRYYELREGGTE